MTGALFWYSVNQQYLTEPVHIARWSTCTISPKRWSGTCTRIVQIVISDERGTLLGTGGGIAKALPQLGEAPFFPAFTDTIWLDGREAQSRAACRRL